MDVQTREIFPGRVDALVERTGGDAFPVGQPDVRHSVRLGTHMKIDVDEFNFVKLTVAGTPAGWIELHPTDGTSTSPKDVHIIDMAEQRGQLVWRRPRRGPHSRYSQVATVVDYNVVSHVPPGQKTPRSAEVSTMFVFGTTVLARLHSTFRLRAPASA